MTTYKNKIGELYTERKTDILTIKELRSKNSELYAEVKNLKDNPIVITKVNTKTELKEIEIHDTAYVGTDGCLYSGGTKVLTTHQDISGKVDKSVGQAAGDIMYFSASSIPTRLAIGTAGQVLKVINGVPSWGDVPVAPMTTSEIETACPYPQNGDIVFNTPTLNITRSSSEPTNASDGDIWIES